MEIFNPISIKRAVSFLCFLFIASFPDISLGTDLRALYGIPPLTEKNIQNWAQIHFPRVPRIEAGVAYQHILSGGKLLILDAQSSQQIFERTHICGAIRVNKYIAVRPDRVPEGYMVVSYCD